MPNKTTDAPGGLALDTELLKPEAAAHQLQISRTKLFALLRSGELESVRIGANRRVPRAALDRYIEGLRTATL